jgi:CRP-like cAMP-binding protein
MSHPDQSSVGNLLLKTMSAADYASLQPYLSRVPIRREMVLAPAGEPVEHVYFLEGAIASIVAHRPGKTPTEIGIFGLEGVSATFLLLGADRSPHETFIQVGDGTGLRIDTDRYLDAIARSTSLHTLLLRYVQSMLIQTAQSAATNAHQRIEARLARWLLMCHDRVEDDVVPLTHEFMGMMIAAERSGVTVRSTFWKGPE